MSLERYSEVDAIFERLLDGGVALGIACGVVIDGRLGHAGGFGELRGGGDLQPDEHSVFRIASITKSFTAAAIILLRDEGRLRFDDPVTSWVPELNVQGLSADSPPISIEHLLTMSSGLPTDDPWGDRQQGLDFVRFADRLRDGVSFVWAPGTKFEYSNLGYGILGRVVTRAAGREYRDFIADRFLGPLEMTATTFERDDVPSERLASPTFAAMTNGSRNRSIRTVPSPPWAALSRL